MPYQNFYATRLANDIGATDTTIPVETIPSVTAGRLVLEARNATQREIIKYTGVSGNNLTGVTRGDGGTTAKSHVKNALVEMNATAADLQDVLDAFGTFAASTNDWRTTLTTVTAVTNNGNRSYDLTVNADMTALLSPGMRLRTTRTVAAPTQSTSLNGTNQYYSKATPAGHTFTTALSVIGHAKPSAYQSSMIATCTSNPGVNGYRFYIDTNGTVVLNAGARYLISYQSVPLNKWSHVAATLDLAAGTGEILIDGVVVPSAISGSGTSFTQAGNLNIGSSNGGAGGFFAGKLSQVAIFSTKISSTTIRSYMSQTLTGSESNLVSAYTFNNSVNDLTANANNLTANGSAVATNADSPFGGQANGTISSTLDYGIVQKITASTITVQVPEGCTIPTTGGVSAVSYSSVKAPFGMPVDVDKFTLIAVNRTLFNKSSGIASTTYYYTNIALQFPVGKWTGGFQLNFQIGSTAASNDSSILLSESTTAKTNTRLVAGFQSVTSSIGGSVYKEAPLEYAAPTNNYLNVVAGSANVTSLLVRGDYEDTIIFAKNAYL